MRLYIQYHGYFGHDYGWHVPMYNAATATDKNKPYRWYQGPSYSYVIRHPDAGWIFFDVGNHRENVNDRIPQESEFFPWFVEPQEHYLPSLDRLGLTPADAGVVILSHLHNDHVGNLDLFSGTHAGRHVIVQRSELEHALYVTHITDNPYADSYFRSDFAGIQGICFEPVDGDVEIAEGVTLLHLPGHTPGTQGLMLQLPESGTVILPSDAVNEIGNWGPPPNPPGILDSKREWLRSVSRLQTLQRRFRARIFFPHDWDQYKNELRVAPDYYE